MDIVKTCHINIKIANNKMVLYNMLFLIGLFAIANKFVFSLWIIGSVLEITEKIVYPKIPRIKSLKIIKIKLFSCIEGTNNAMIIKMIPTNNNENVCLVDSV